MRRITAILSFLLLAPLSAHAFKESTRDASGRMTGEAETRSGTTTYRDSSGRTTGQAERRGDTTT